MPDVPTMAEAGWPPAEVVVWAGIMAPAGVPRTIVRKLERAFVEAALAAEVRDRLVKLGADPVGRDGEGLRRGDREGSGAVAARGARLGRQGRMKEDAMGRLTGKIAIVTGAASGIGAASAKLFADEGAQVLAVDRPESAIDTAHAGNNAIAAFGGDITGDDAPKKIVAAALEKFGAIDILFNNAGVSGRAFVEEMTDEIGTASTA